MKTRSFHRPACVLLFLLLAGTSHGLDKKLEAKRLAFEELGKVREWKDRAWKNAYSYRTLSYTVKSNTSYKTCQYVARLMELTARKYRAVFGLRFTRPPMMTIHAYAKRDEYETLAVKGRFRLGVTNGFYDPLGVGAIHLPWVMSRQTHPSSTLYHEGTHQFVHQVADFRVPMELYTYFPPDKRILQSVPIWLNEGLATYMETAWFDGETVRIGTMNRNRLWQLRSMLQSKTAPGIKEVLSRRYGQPFGSEHYAVACGLLYSLRHHQKASTRKNNRRKLNQYVKECKKGFMALPITDFRKLFVKDGEIAAGFGTQWRVYVGQKSLEAFEKIVVGRGKSIEKWEENWVKWILALDFRKPYGGNLSDTGDIGDDKLY